MLLKKGLLLCMAVLFLSACSTNLNAAEEKEELRQKLIEVNRTGAIGEIGKAHIDEAVSAASQLELEGKDRDRFVLYHLIYATNDIEMDKEDVYENSQLRLQYEETWKDLAVERYGIQVEEERLQEIIEKDATALKDDVFSPDNPERDTQLYLAEELGYSVDEYVYQFTAPIFEQREIRENLYPLLEEEYGTRADHEVSHQYQMEVIDEIVEAQF
ncbi:hypothetical protein JSY36_05560 [Bacillus sp. H-16]|uniref:hypothetical protein n=1 Tax=Alteribacter salitolerans TaxID=2912333 RepID=UPI0019622FFA|nr:hypothetical protein [Alteribacter salitolerans]MBM7095218.1 hypothetical protein [Alteribacter salitolerans]